MMMRRPEFLMMRPPQILMMRRPCAALRRPENPDRSAPILLLASFSSCTLTSSSVCLLMVFVEGTNFGPKSSKSAVPAGRLDVDDNTVTLGSDVVG
jgi:hypothetical protein